MYMNSNQGPFVYYYNVASLLACQTMCNSNGGCGYFGYDCSLKTCYLKSQSGGNIAEPLMISGRKTCWILQYG